MGFLKFLDSKSIVSNCNLHKLRIALYSSGTSHKLEWTIDRAKVFLDIVRLLSDLSR